MTTFRVVHAVVRYLLVGHNVDGGEAQYSQRQPRSLHNSRDHLLVGYDMISAIIPIV